MKSNIDPTILGPAASTPGPAGRFVHSVNWHRHSTVIPDYSCLVGGPSPDEMRLRRTALNNIMDNPDPIRDIPIILNEKLAKFRRIAPHVNEINPIATI
jgi:hypothetical protein